MTLLAVTGTCTGVGTTVTCAAVAACTVASGRSAAVLKLAQTGADGAPGDVQTVRRLAGHGVTTRELRRFPESLPPDIAARRTGLDPVNAPEAAAAARELEREHDLVLIEGTGGLLVRFDGTGATLADIAWALGAPTLIVAAAGIGARNHTALTALALTSAGVHCAGLVIGSWPQQPGPVERSNLAELPREAGAPLLGALPEQLGTASQGAFAGIAATALSPWFGGGFDPERFAERYALDSSA